MPKSKQRKGHKEKVASYRKKVEDQKKLLMKKQREFIEGLQKAEMDKMTAEGTVQNVVDSSEVGIDVDDMGLDIDVEPMFDENPIIETIEPSGGFVEGITSPEQLNK